MEHEYIHNIVYQVSLSTNNYNGSIHHKFGTQIDPLSPIESVTHDKHMHLVQQIDMSHEKATLNIT